MSTRRLFCIILTLALCAACSSEPGAGLPERQMSTCGAQLERECDEDTETWPDWQREDVQPASPRFGETYGLDAFEGKPVFVSFLVGWCGYCQAQAAELDTLRTDPMFVEVAFVVVHGASANNDADREALLELGDGSPRHGMIMFQDTAQVDAWSQHGGSKDDFYIYKADGTLSSYLEGGQQTNLSSDSGRQFVRDALLAAMD